MINRTYYDDLHRAIQTIRNLTGQAITDPIPPTFDPAHPDRNVGAETQYDSSGRVYRTIDPAGKITQSCYNVIGQVVKVVENPSVADPCVSYTPSNDKDQDITTQSTYDVSGNLYVRIDANGKRTSYQYDALGRMILQVEALQNTTQTSYDAAGNKLTQTDPRGVVTKFEYDSLARLTAVVENYRPGVNPTSDINVRTEYTYDATGNRLTIKDGRLNVTTFGYDDLNRLLSETDALSHTTLSAYDAIGNRLQTVDANGATINFQYDGLNRPILIDYPAPDSDVTYTYDNAGNQSTMSDGQGATQWDYDELNRPTSITDPLTGAVQYGYDVYGRRTSLTYPNNQQVSYLYDDAGRLSIVTDYDALTTTYTYDRGGRPASITRPNSVISSYQYNPAGQLASITHTNGTQTLSSYQYSYDPNGNRSSTTETALTTPPATDLIFGDGFETGNLASWTSAVTDGGNLSVSTQAAIVGSQGMQMELNDNTSIYVSDTTPSAATHYRSRFYFDPNAISMASGDAHYIFYGLNASSNSVVRIEFRFSAGDYQVRADALLDTGSWSGNAWTTITDGPHGIEIDWKAATAVGANNGVLTLWIDGAQQVTNTSLDNDTQRVETARLGAVAGIDSTTRGNYYIDGFESHSTNFIGLDSNALTPPAPPIREDAIFSEGFESGNLNSWSQTAITNGTLSVSSQAAMVGANGMQAVINGYNSALFVTDWSSYNETHYRSRFYFDPDYLTHLLRT